MSARAMGSLTLSFGLVSIPVKLYSACTSRQGLEFRLLHKGCGSTLKQQYVCAADGKVVPVEDRERGVEVSPDNHVVLSADELLALAPPGEGTITIQEVVPLDSVDPVLYERAYYLGTERGGDQAYALLATALRESGRGAIARYVARDQEHLALVRAKGKRLVLQQLRWGDEILAETELPELGKPKELAAADLELAAQLVNRLASPSFDAAAWVDESKARAKELVQRKVDGKEIVTAPGAVEKKATPIIDLREALKKSLEAQPKKAKRPRKVS